MELLKIEHIKKSFDGLKVVDDLSFTLEKGKITSLIGPNGAGKTTLFNILSGLCKADSGDIYFNSNSIFNKSPYYIANLGIGRTFQNIKLFPQISVWDNVLLASQNHSGEHFIKTLLPTKQVHEDEKNAEEKAMECLEFVGLFNKKEYFAENLSYGQKKLLGLAITLATGADLLLLDEPTAGVYPETRKKILELLGQLRDQGKTILFIEHDMKIVMDISDIVIVMNYGKKIVEGSPENVKNNQDVKDAYLGRGNGSS
ncbi:MAG: ABC transporter ATP-binding protein [Sedimentisphaerales bacterium]|nr:ABC transporter ATP-binding protein [Sedimentisphaerales bacterium]